MRQSFSVIITALFLSAGALQATPAKTDEYPSSFKPAALAKQVPSSLPGVKPAKPIVQTPQAEPHEPQPSPSQDGSFMIGNTKVKISGSVTVDVGNMRSTHN